MAQALGPNHFLCICSELHCEEVVSEFEGKIIRGRRFHRTSYSVHQAQIKAIQSLPNPPPPQNSLDATTGRQPGSESATQLSSTPNPLPSSQAGPSNPTLHPDHPATSVSHNPPDISAPSHPARKRGRSDSDNDTLPLQSQTDRPTKAIRYLHVYNGDGAAALPGTFLQHPLCLREMLKITQLYLFDRLSDSSIRASLIAAQGAVSQQLADEFCNSKLKPWTQIPSTTPSLLAVFQLDTNIQSAVCCPFCCFLYRYDPKIQPPPSDQICSHPRFFTEKNFTREKELCKADLFQKPSKGLVLKPQRLFHYQRLQSWLGKMLTFPKFETALDASLNRSAPADDIMRDIWDGDEWKTFRKSGKIFTQTSGNLVFGFYCDWFNPHGTGARRHISVGVILLVCFNLPPEIRYQQQNICLYGIIPGPGEPSLTTECNHIFQPLVDEMNEFWGGIHFPKTSQSPQGRLIHAALWPLQADVPAMKKVAGFTSHSSTNFCSHCFVSLSLYDTATIHSRWRLRDDRSHSRQALEWENAPSAGEQEALAKKNGVRYSVFSQLPYWKPISYITIDIMHNILLGLLKDLSSTYLQLPQAGAKLKNQKDSMAFKQGIHDVAIPPPKTQCLVNPSSSSGVENLQQSNPPPPPQSHHSYNTRSTRSELHYASASKHTSAASDKSDKTVQEGSTNPPVPVIIAHELDVLQRCIRQAITPSWLTRPAHNFGMKGAGTPKAADWLIVYSVYMVLSLIPQLREAEPGSHSNKIFTAIMLATLITKMAFSRLFKQGDAKELEEYIRQYQDHLRHAWPGIKPKPNLHYTQHLPQIVKRFGPPAYTACWAGERVIGSLVRTPKNGNPNSLGNTLIQAHTRRSFFKHTISHLEELIEKDSVLKNYFHTRQPKWTPSKLTPEMFELMQSSGFIGSEIELTNVFNITKCFVISNKSYSTQTMHQGNSQIEYHHLTEKHFGSIINIIQLPNHQSPIFVVKQLDQLHLSDIPKSPYSNMSKILQASIVYDTYTNLHAIRTSQVIGHFVGVSNIAGTFDIPQKTMSIVSLGNMAYLQAEDNDQTSGDTMGKS